MASVGWFLQHGRSLSQFLNAGVSVVSLDQMQTLASIATVVRHHFPPAQVNLTHWQDNPQTRLWSEPESLDFAFHFPEWTPRLQCRSLLFQLRVQPRAEAHDLQLLGILMKGMTYDGERWRLATVGSWDPEGPRLPQSEPVDHLRHICRKLFDLFSDSETSDTAA